MLEHDLMIVDFVLFVIAVLITAACGWFFYIRDKNKSYRKEILVGVKSAVAVLIFLATFILLLNMARGAELELFPRGWIEGSLSHDTLGGPGAHCLTENPGLTFEGRVMLEGLRYGKFGLGGGYFHRSCAFDRDTPGTQEDGLLFYFSLDMW